MQLCCKYKGWIYKCNIVAKKYFAKFHFEFGWGI